VRFGLTLPVDGVPLGASRELVQALPGSGYTDVWSAEGGSTDAVTPLALAAAWEPRLHLGTAILSTFTRGPAVLAQTAATLCAAAPGRVTVGLGASSDVIVRDWNAMAFDRPYQRTRDVIRFLRRALAGEKVSEEYETFAVRGFQLPTPPDPAPPILLAALRPGMLRLAGKEADGAILNWLSADDIRTVVPVVGPGEAACRIIVWPTEDAELVRRAAKRLIAAYLNVPVYKQFHQWLGRGDAMAECWAAWEAGDRKRALDAIPDEVVDDLVVHGSPEACRRHVQRYVDNGVTIPVLAVLGLTKETAEVVLELASSAR
jgi:probable F420-dependent oxidoreductase